MFIKNKDKQKKYSIVMGYYNRKEQTLQTLNSMKKLYKDKYNFEVIIVDDDSKYEEILDDSILKYEFPIKLLRITDDEKKNRINSCLVYNKGFEECNGEIVIIQNPECIHIGDILGFLEKKFKYDTYFSFPCFNSNNYQVNKYIYNNFDELNINNIFEKQISLIMMKICKLAYVVSTP